MVLHDLLIMHGLVIEPRHIYLIREMVANGVIPIIEAGGCRPSRVFLMNETTQAPGLFPAVSLLLFRNFIADAPQNDAGMVAVAANHVAQDSLRPLVVILVVAV